MAGTTALAAIDDSENNVELTAGSGQLQATLLAGGTPTVMATLEPALHRYVAIAHLPRRSSNRPRL